MTSVRIATLALPLLVLSLGGCASLLVEANDSQCARDLDAVERTADAAQSELDRGMPAEQRQAALSRMVDAAGRARASCGYDVPDTDGTRRARQPKAG
ncbi:hypothetical protein [Salinisphaera aquimarina]|uniref:Lipoprotein n=1 Tax=Salinisphaera aquimarina TaxID=2094031 RepID=A0ABV7ET86_9GAMM